MKSQGLMSDEFFLALVSILWLVNSLLFHYCEFIAALMFGNQVFEYRFIY